MSANAKADVTCSCTHYTASRTHTQLFICATQLQPPIVLLYLRSLKLTSLFLHYTQHDALIKIDAGLCESDPADHMTKQWNKK